MAGSFEAGRTSFDITEKKLRERNAETKATIAKYLTKFKELTKPLISEGYQLEHYGEFIDWAEKVHVGVKISVPKHFNTGRSYYRPNFVDVKFWCEEPFLLSFSVDSERYEMRKLYEYADTFPIPNGSSEIEPERLLQVLGFWHEQELKRFKKEKLVAQPSKDLPTKAPKRNLLSRIFGR